MIAKALTVEQFRAYVKKRKRRETFADIAADLGVTRQAVQNWVARCEPPRIVLLAAAMHIQIEKRRG